MQLWLMVERDHHVLIIHWMQGPELDHLIDQFLLKTQTLKRVHSTRPPHQHTFVTWTSPPTQTARHSTMLNAMFFGRFEESRRDEIKVGDVAEKSLQRFLDLTVGVHKVLTDENVEKVLVLADYWDAQIVKKICEESKTMGIPKKLEGATTGSTNSSNLACTKTFSLPKESTIRQKWNFGFGGSQQLR
ncbi:hypothetical protein CRE_20064 [Caenorhabditis remanei]|uniref:BTB domain-containing protein n=1 Tax=Caenorhabditis remanei TaxID=31234 RepID=E3NHG9_CAERE|nr:hypothetical protein CRE_20064 [Caenorhabditis remanei]